MDFEQLRQITDEAEQGYRVDALELADNNVRVFREKLAQKPEAGITL